MAQSVEVVDLVSDEEEQLDDGPIDLTNDTPPSSPSRAYQGHQHLQPTAVPAADPAEAPDGIESEPKNDGDSSRSPSPRATSDLGASDVTGDNDSRSHGGSGAVAMDRSPSSSQVALPLPVPMLQSQAPQDSQRVDESSTIAAIIVPACNNDLAKNSLLSEAPDIQAKLCGLHTVHPLVSTETERQPQEHQLQQQQQSSPLIPGAFVQPQHCFRQAQQQPPDTQQQSPELQELPPLWPPCTGKKRSPCVRRAHSQPLQPQFLNQLPSSGTNKRSRSVLDTDQRTAKRQATMDRETREQPSLPLLPFDRLPDSEKGSHLQKCRPISSPMTSAVQHSHLSPFGRPTQPGGTFTQPCRVVRNTPVNGFPVVWTPEMVTELAQAVGQVSKESSHLTTKTQQAKAVWQQIGCPTGLNIASVRHKIRRLGRNQQEGSKVRYRSPRRNNSMSVSDSNVSLTPSGPADLTTATFAKASVSAAAARVLEDFEFPRPESALLLLETHQERPGRTSLPAQAEANCGAAVKESSSLSLHLTPPVEGRLAASHSNLQETSTATDGSKDSIMSAATQRKTCPASSATIFDNSVPVGGGKNTIAVAEETLSLQQHGSSKTLHDTQVSSGSGTRFSLQQASAPTAQSRGPLRKGGTWIPRGDAAQPRPYPACYVAGLPRGTLPRGDLPHGDQQTTGSDHPSSQSAGGAERDTDIARSAGSVPPDACLPASKPSPLGEANAGIHHIAAEATARATTSELPEAESGVPASTQPEAQRVPAAEIEEEGGGGQQKQVVSDQAGLALQDADFGGEVQQELEQHTAAASHGQRPPQDLTLVLDQAPPLTMQLPPAYQVDPAARVAMKQRLSDYDRTVARLQSKGQVITNTDLGLPASAVKRTACSRHNPSRAC